MNRSPGVSLGAALFAALFAAAVLSAALVVRERDPALALEVTNFSAAFEPDGDGVRDVAKLEFFARESDPGATGQHRRTGPRIGSNPRQRPQPAGR